MGVDGIDKADIFDEYFDNDKPKQTNYEKIKSMDIDTMARWITTMVNFDCHDCNTLERCDDCFEMNKQWLLAESEG